MSHIGLLRPACLAVLMMLLLAASAAAVSPDERWNMVEREVRAFQERLSGATSAAAVRADALAFSARMEEVSDELLAQDVSPLEGRHRDLVVEYADHTAGTWRGLATGVLTFDQTLELQMGLDREYTGRIERAGDLAEVDPFRDPGRQAGVVVACLLVGLGAAWGLRRLVGPRVRVDAPAG